MTTTGGSVLSNRRRRRLLLIGTAIAAGMLMAGTGWACTIPDDTRTLFDSCTKPVGASKDCKEMLGYPAFPFATNVAGPSGSSVNAYVPGPGLQPSTPYELRWVSSAQRSQGITCGSAQATVLAGPVLSGAIEDESINTTRGVIPAGSSLGKGQVCFADTASSSSIQDSLPAIFKVNL